MARESWVLVITDMNRDKGLMRLVLIISRHKAVRRLRWGPCKAPTEMTALLAQCTNNGCRGSKIHVTLRELTVEHQQPGRGTGTCHEDSEARPTRLSLRRGRGPRAGD